MPDYNLGTARGEIILSSNTKGADDAKKAVEDVKKSAEDGASSADDLALGFGAVGAAVAGGFALAVNSAGEFEKRLSAIKAVSGASGAEMETLRNKALQLGKDTSFSASESALAIEELAKAGVSVPDIMNGAADATVNLAAAGEIALPRAAEVASDAMNAFGLSAKELPHVADIFAGAANASSVGVEELAQSMQQASAVAAVTGVSFEDTATAISLLGNAGIKGSDAGTSLKTMLQNLNPQTEKQMELAKELGIITEDGANAFFDATGKAKSMAEIAQVLQTALKGQTQQQKLATLETLFGSDAIRAAAIVSTAGAKGFNELSDSISKVSAADVAAERLNNFKGTLEQVKGSAETLAIQIGTPLLNGFRAVLEGVNGVLGAFLELDDGTRTLLSTVGLIAGGLALSAAAMFKFIGTISGVKSAIQGAVTAFQNLGRAGRIATISMGAIGIALTVLTAAYTVFATRNAEAENNARALAEAMDQQTGAMTKSARQILFTTLQEEGLADAADKAGISQGTLLKAVEQGGKTLDGVKLQFREYIEEQIRQGMTTTEGAKAINDFNSKADGQVTSIDKAKKSLQQHKEAGLVPATGATGELTEAQVLQNQELAKAAEAARLYQEQLKKIVDSMILMGTITLDAREAERQYQEALDAVTQSIATNGRTLDVNTEKGRANQEALDGIASATFDTIEAMGKAVDVNGKAVYTQDQMNEKLVRGASDLYAAARAYGLSEQAADAYVESIFGVPGSKVTKLITDKQQAEANLKSIKRQLADPNLTKTRRAKLEADKRKAEAALREANRKLTAFGRREETATVKVTADLSAYYAKIRRLSDSNRGPLRSVPGSSEGGRIRGPRGRDRAGIYALEHDEFVLRAASARKIGYENLERLNRGDLSAMSSIVAPNQNGGSINPVAAAKAGINLTQNIYNPVNEPTSVTTNRELQRLSALGILNG